MKQINLFNEVVFLFSRERALTAWTNMMSTSNSFKRIKHLPHTISDVVFAACDKSKYGKNKKLSELMPLLRAHAAKMNSGPCALSAKCFQIQVPFLHISFLFSQIQNLKIRVNNSLRIQGLNSRFNKSLSSCIQPQG